MVAKLQGDNMQQETLKQTTLNHFPVLPDTLRNLGGIHSGTPQTDSKARDSEVRDTEVRNKGRQKHINSCNINFLAPTQTPLILGPKTKFICLVSWERTQKRDPHKLFWGDFGGSKTGSQTGHFRPQKV